MTKLARPNWSASPDSSEPNAPRKVSERKRDDEETERHAQRPQHQGCDTAADIKLVV